MSKSAEGKEKEAKSTPPMIAAKIKIGNDTDKSQKKKALTFSLFQPQLLRVLKTVEIISAFNMFKELSLNEFYTTELSEQQSKDYLKNYMEWKSKFESSKKHERQRAEAC